jgi:predicted regulator of Ras-like GTPase activity (Roadblock/LC7/MglB family)
MSISIYAVPQITLMRDKNGFCSKNEAHVAMREIFDKISNDLGNIGNVEVLAVTSRDGLLIYSNIQQEQNIETFAAMSAILLGAGEIATLELGKGIPNRITVESKHGVIITTGAGSKALLIVTMNSNADLGLVLDEVEKVSKEIKQILDRECNYIC